MYYVAFNNDMVIEITTDVTVVWKKFEDKHANRIMSFDTLELMIEYLTIIKPQSIKPQNNLIDKVVNEINDACTQLFGQHYANGEWATYEEDFKSTFKNILEKSKLTFERVKKEAKDAIDKAKNDK